MASEAQDDFDVTNAYTDIVATVAAIASVDTIIQNIGQTRVSILPQASGVSADADQTGFVLEPLDSVQVNAAQVWAKAYGSSGKVSLVTI